MKPQDDLAICRSVKYYKTARKDARKCKQCGFFFIPDHQLYEKQSFAVGVESSHLTGVEWFAQFQCCPNCFADSKRRCQHCGNPFTPTGNQKHNERRKYNRAISCRMCNPKTKKTEANKIRALTNAKNLYRRLRRAFTIREWDSSGFRPSSKTLLTWFGTWREFISLLDSNARVVWLTPVRKRGKGLFKRQYSDESILESLRLAYIQHDRALSHQEWNLLHLKPSWGVVAKRFGWSRAWRMIGASPRIGCCDWETNRDEILRARGIHPDQVKERNQQLLEAINRASQRLAENERKWNEQKFKKKNLPLSSDTPLQESA